jgi:hypothetical protein
MTVYLKNIRGTIKEMEELFDVDHTISVRFFEQNFQGNFNITIRCNEDFESNLKFKKTIKGILKTL